MKHFIAKRATLRHRLRSLYFTLFSYGRSFLIMFVCLWCGNFISTLIPVKIPGSIIGLILLFLLLVFQLIPTRWIRCGCNLMMKYMTILFIPAAMGIMDSYIYVIAGWAPIIVGSIISTFIVMVIIGFMTQNLHSKDRKKMPKKGGSK